MVPLLYSGSGGEESFVSISLSLPGVQMFAPLCVFFSSHLAVPLENLTNSDKFVFLLCTLDDGISEIGNNIKSEPISGTPWLYLLYRTII